MSRCEQDRVATVCLQLPLDKMTVVNKITVTWEQGNSVVGK